MSKITAKTIELMEMLPEDDQKFALEFIKKLVLAWDPDFTKMTDIENASLDNAKLEHSFNSSEMDWDNPGNLDLN